MKIKNPVNKAIATVGVIALGLNSGNALAQSQDHKIITDSVRTEIRNYDPITVIQPNTTYQLNNEKDSVYTDDPYYSLDGIEAMLNRYDAGLIRPNKSKGGIGNREIELFREESTAGVGEYSMRPKDINLLTVMAKALNNRNSSEEVGDITLSENKEIFKAMKEAGHTEVKVLAHKKFEPTIKIITYTHSTGKVEVDTVAYPAKDVAEAYRLELEDILQGNDCPTCKVLGIYIEGTALYSKEIDKIMPQIGAGLKYKRFGLGLTGAYTQFNKNDIQIFDNIQGNGYTRDSTNVGTNMKSIGVNGSFDISKAISLCLGAQDNIINTTTTGAVAQSTTDGVAYGYNKIPKNREQKNKNYWTWSTGGNINITDHLSIPVNVRFNKDKFEGAYTGLRYTFGGHK